MSSNPVLDHYKVAESNVFLMTRFRKTAHHDEIVNAVAQAVRAFGLEFIKADDPNFAAPGLWQRVEFCMKACAYGIAVFETINEPDFNPNVSLELGYMLALNRKCLLLKEKQIKGLMTDLGGFYFKEFDSDDINATILGQVSTWLQEVGVRKRASERVIAFVSGGGTCRCAMSKALTKHYLGNTKVGERIRVESRAAFGPSRAVATNAAIEVARKKLGEDLLSEHRPRQMGVGFLYEADLILATDRWALHAIHNLFRDYPGSDADKKLVEAEITRKSFLLSEFFGKTGDIRDPWPDTLDDAAIARYQECIDDLDELMSGQVHKLTEFVFESGPRVPETPTVAFGSSHLSA
jgi:protein-tyrosine-phosphatase